MESTNIPVEIEAKFKQPQILFVSHDGEVTE